MIRDRIGPKTGINGPLVDAIADALDAVFEGFQADLDADLYASREGLERLARHVGLIAPCECTDAQLLFAIRLRARSRNSSATLPEMILFAQEASPSDLGTADSGPVYVRLYVAGADSLDAIDTARLIEEALLAIPDVAGLSIVAPAENAFTFDLGPGFDAGVLSGLVYP